MTVRLLASVSLVAAAVLAGALTLAVARAARLRRTLADERSAVQADRHRADVLEEVVVAGQQMASLEVDEVLRAVVDSVARLGFGAADLVVIDGAGLTYRVLHHRGLPVDYTSGRFSANRGIVGEVLRSQSSIAIDHYADHDDRLEVLDDAGFQSVLAVPVWAEGRIAGVLEAGTRHHAQVDPVRRDAMELLAAQAGLALENAMRHENEQRAVARLGRLEQLMRDFLTTAAHELRTPVTVVRSMSQTLHKRWDQLDDGTRSDLIERLTSNAVELDALVARVLEFNELEGGLTAVRETVCNLSEVVAVAVAANRHLFVDHELHAAIGRDVHVMGDAHLLQRAVSDLLANAAKHTPPDTAVLVELREEHSDAVVQITDDGPGIEPADLAHVTEPFVRGGDVDTRTARGLGLGLAFVREILDLHRTGIEVTSRPGRGSSFSFRLPTVRSGRHNGDHAPPTRQDVPAA